MAHHRMKLSDPDMCSSMRPELGVWFDPSDPDSQGVTLTIGASWGAARRFVCLSPDEARHLAKLIVKAATEADAHALVQLVEPVGIDPNLQYPGKDDAIGPFPEENA